MLTYSRFVPRETENFERAVVETVDHVRAHLSSCADPDDSTNRFHTDASIVYDERPDGTHVFGQLNEEPTAPYLRADFDPASDTDYTFTRYSEAGRE